MSSCCVMCLYLTFLPVLRFARPAAANTAASKLRSLLFGEPLESLKRHPALAPGLHPEPSMLVELEGAMRRKIWMKKASMRVP